MIKISRGRDIFKKYEPLITLLVKFIGIFPKRSNQKFYSLIKNLPGNAGLGIRYVYLRNLCKSCGDNVSIHPNVILLNMENLIIGDNVSIHPFSYIDADGSVEIGNDVSIAHGTSILSSSHNFADNSIPIKDQGLSFSKVKIEDNVWVGCKVTILSGINIRKGTIIGANAVL